MTKYNLIIHYVIQQVNKNTSRETHANPVSHPGDMVLLYYTLCHSTSKQK